MRKLRSEFQKAVESLNFGNFEEARRCLIILQASRKIDFSILKKLDEATGKDGDYQNSEV